ncbi:MAG: hypothetical protein RL571_1319 [Pseudomonadota bacterium]|jgi:uncharacterized protein (TIGR02646 family)
MRKIIKSTAPAALTRWKRDHPKGKYAETDYTVRQEIRVAALKEQYYLCAYCCQSITEPITEKNCHNEHIEAQAFAPKRTLDFDNIVASCNAKHQCGEGHGSQALLLTPLMDECETELKFYISGEVEGLTERAKDAIRILNLGDSTSTNRQLIEKRKQLIDGFIWTNVGDPSDGFEDDELISMLIEDCQIPKDGKLEAFAPIFKNIMSAWITKPHA